MAWVACWQAPCLKEQLRVINHMNNLVKTLGVICLILLGLSACTSETQTVETNIKYKWELLQVIYDDGSINQLGEENFVLIEDDEIVEVINQNGRRRYSYVRENSVLYVTFGDAVVEWEVISLDAHNLQLRTPIGVYVLQR